MMTGNQTPEHAPTTGDEAADVDPRDAVRVMLVEAEMMRAQVGLPPIHEQDQQLLRDISPFGR